MVKVAEKKKRMHPLLPIMGIAIAVCVAVMAYFVSPLAIDQIAKQMGEQEFTNRVGDSRQQLEYAFAALFFLVFFSLAMGIVAAAIGEDPEDENRLVQPREGDTKAIKKYLKAQRKLEERRAKQGEAKRRAEERANAKRK